MAKARKAQSDVDSSTIDIGIDSERRSRQFVKVTRCSARVASLVPCSNPPTPRRKRSPSDRVALEHYAELALVWPADPRIPTAASRRAWCLARGLKPEVVNVWWYRRKTVAKRLGLRIPEDKYELDVGVPPVVAIKQYDELDDLDIKPRVKTENLDEDVALLLGLDLGNAQKAAQEKRSGYTESSRSVSPSATLLAPSSDGHALLNVPSSEFGAILEDQMLQNSSPPPEEGAYNWVTNDAQRPTDMVAKEHLEAFAPVDLSQTQPLARSLRLPNDILYYQRKAYEADSDDRQTQGGHLTRVNSPATTGIVLPIDRSGICPLFLGKPLIDEVTDQPRNIHHNPVQATSEMQPQHFSFGNSADQLRALSELSDCLMNRHIPLSGSTLLRILNTMDLTTLFPVVSDG